jgi:type III secretory pathway lipoprotein EscJ
MDLAPAFESHRASESHAFKVRRVVSRGLSKKVRSFSLVWALSILCACRESIVHDLQESGANRIVARLSAVGMKAEKSKQSDGLWTITLDRVDAVRAIAYLDRLHLLPRAPSIQPENGSFLTNKEEQRFSYERRLSAAIEETLLNLPGVQEARVHLNVLPGDPISLEIPAGDETASALLIVDGRDEVSAESVEALIAGASGIRVENIKVILTRQSEIAPPALESDAQAGEPEHRLGGSGQMVEVGLWFLLLVVGGSFLWIGGRPLFRKRPLAA